MYAEEILSLRTTKHSAGNGLAAPRQNQLYIRKEKEVNEKYFPIQKFFLPFLSSILKEEDIRKLEKEYLIFFIKEENKKGFKNEKSGFKVQKQEKRNKKMNFKNGKIVFIVRKGKEK